MDSSKRRKENQIIQNLCLSRKQENYQFLKKWDFDRAVKLKIHRRMTDEIEESLQQKLSQSNAYIDVVRQFLSDLLNQKIKYELQTVTNPETKIKDNLIGHNLHLTSGRQIGRFYHLTNNYKGYKKLKQVLEEGLGKIQQLLIESKRQIIEIKTKIELKIHQITLINEQMAENCNNLMTIFGRDKFLKPLNSQTDFFSQVQKFIYEAYYQNIFQRDLGVYIVEYVEYIEQLEKRKLILIKQVIGSYLDAISEEGQEQLNFLKDILGKGTQSTYIEECYSAQELISKELIIELGKIEGKHEREVNLKHLKVFLKKYKRWQFRFEYEYFESINYLILKQYHIFIKYDEELEEVLVMITVDAFINIVLTKKQTDISGDLNFRIYQQMDISIRVDTAMGIQSEGDIMLKLTPKKWKMGQGFKKHKKIFLIFSTEDQRDQFCEFIDKIMY